MPIQSAQIVVPVTDLNASLEFFTALGFRLYMIMPADAPSEAVVSGYGTTIKLETGAEIIRQPLSLRLLCNYADLQNIDKRDVTGPDGVRVEFVESPSPMIIPPIEQKFILTRYNEEMGWIEGRAGMQYRDLIPGRLGGAIVASHIRIPEGGETPDYVHYHRVLFQMIYCKAGWARLVYEDQGPPFIMNAGDCVLQPPGVRHRVLETSPGFEVIEIGCPAVHETYRDHDMTLPTPNLSPGRLFDGQRFVHHTASAAVWVRGGEEGFEIRDTGIAEATGGLLDVRVFNGACAPLMHGQEDQFLFYYVLEGEAALRLDNSREQHLVKNDCCVIPSGSVYSLDTRENFSALRIQVRTL